MNEHIRIRRVVEGLRNHLKSKDFGDEFRSLIASYNNSCRQLKQRLEQVDAILLSGNTSGALKMAETDPSVLDLLTLLGFAQSQDLKDWCNVNGVSFEGNFEDALIHRLNEAYSSNSETDSKLEKEYRKAILKKDYASALPIARTMARLQPNDSAAHTELKNTERRYAKKLEHQLDAALRSEDVNKARALLSEFDNLSCGDYSGGEIVGRARQLVQEQHDEAGIAHIDELLEQAPENPEFSEWLEFEALYDRILEIKGSISVSLPPEVEAKWSAFSKLERAFRGRVTHANSQRIALEKLRSVVSHAQTDRITSKQTGLSQKQSSLENLLSAAKNAESLGSEIDPELQSRWQEEVLHLRGKIELMLKALRLKRVMIAGTSVVILTCIGLTAYFFARSSKIVSQADVILANKDLSSARAFANANYPEEWLLGISQAVKARHEKVRQFITIDEQDATILEEKLKAFEGSKGKWSSDIRSMVFADGQLKALYAATEGLSKESARPIRLELDRVENELAVVRNEFARNLVAEAESELSVMEEKILPQLSLSQPPEQLLSVIESATKALNELATIDARGQGVVGITEDQKLRRQSVLKSKEAALSAVVAHNDFTEKLMNASSIEAYNDVIAAGLIFDYIGSPYYKHLLDLPKSFDEADFRKVAFGNLPKVFSDLIGGGSLAPLSPPSALLPREVDAYAEFRFNEMVDGIQMHEVVVPKPTRTVRMYSIGDIKDDGKFSAGGDLMRAYVSGSIYYPHIEKGQIKFVDYEGMLVSGLNSYGDLPEMKMLKALEVDELLSSQREVFSGASNPAPFLKLIDQMREYETASADYRCFAIIQLFEMMESADRPEQWGLSYLPNWEVEVESLKSLGVQNGDWLRESSGRKIAEANSGLSDFFDGVSLENLARVNRSLVNGILQSKVKYHGYIDYDDENAVSQYNEVPTFARSQTSAQWIQMEDGESKGDYKPLSPVLSISPGLTEIYNQVCTEMNVDAYTAAQIANYLGIKFSK